ncbi:solute carrier family 22 member 7-like isoform X1 [Rhinichthys klamathensis goyatoka]|uniref:solute carrier family 22 member 7-like isoform X1 n=2 Tax=Rhinichthys klamathensis goyatoka TaxID=3034132 RepID=UPI0024B4A2C0|nr:solute carrier family 22 member 7-like isoform X1 [Rhinichthys klamathensis goyatoka]
MFYCLIFQVTMKFDSILDKADGFGRYQIALALLLFIPRITIPCHFLLNNFIAAIPSHHCDISSLDADRILGNLSREERLTVSIPAQEDGTPASCHIFSYPQFHLLMNSSSSTERPVVECQNGWEYDNSTFISTLATQFDLVCDKRGLAKTSVTIFFCGVMAGAVFFGVLCDKYGRRSMLLVSYVLSIVFSVASAFSSTYIMFAAFRFLTGLALTGIVNISVGLSIEWVDTKHRTFIGVFGSISWSLGNMLLAGFAYLVTDWRMLIITVTSPLLLATATWWWIPESARWLIANGKAETAYKYLQNCATFNKRRDFSSRVKPESLSTVATQQGHSYTYLDLVKTPQLRRLTLFTGIVWYGVSSTYYGISLNITGFGLDLYLTHFIYAAIEVPAKFVLYFSLNKVGRRVTQSGTLVLTGFCILINIITPTEFWTFRTVIAVLGKGLSEASFTTVFLYTTELYPTVMRQNGLGYTSFMARLGASISPLIMLLEDKWMVLPEVIFCTLAIFSGLIAWLLPETNNARLPETIEDIEETRKKPVYFTTEDQSNIPLKLPISTDTTQ